MSILDSPRTLAKAAAKWDENLHPRDRLGRFIETGAEVRVWGGVGGRVVRNIGGGRIEIQRADGSHAVVHRNYLTVIQRPDGSAPTAQQAPDVAELPEQAEPEAPDAEEVPIPQEPTPGADVVRDKGTALADQVEDQKLAGEIRARTAAYHSAVTNNVPDDEADERAALLDTLATVAQRAGDNRDVADLAAEVRIAATADPDATPEATQPARPGGDVDFADVGRQARRNGEPAAASLNPQVREALEGLPVGSPESRRILADFSRLDRREPGPRRAGYGSAGPARPDSPAAR